MKNGLKVWTCFFNMLLFVNACPVHSSAFPSSSASVEGKFSKEEIVKELNKPPNVELLKKITAIVYNRDKSKPEVKDKMPP
ncbi:MAG: hypothetical protein K2X53_02445 [Alphaproteobacteria bacterium]|nr:hypothetical protein [Alphaproteobacteria bacterium]